MRGRAMQKAVPVGVGAMAALARSRLRARRWRSRTRPRRRQVLPGRQRQWRRAGRGFRRQGGGRARLEIAKTRGAKRAMLLPVSAPFHCSADAARRRRHGRGARRGHHQATGIAAGRRTCWPRRSREPDEYLVAASSSRSPEPARWRESVLIMAQAGVTTFYEIGAGKVLTGLIKRIAEAANASAIGTPEDVSRFKAARG